MPLTRYQIRNEYSLADPELYKAADRDDPEALLEGIAMAGLVGVLRQLGDLAEFAAEIFHDLHEEVMATAARGHGLMVRVQQLEAEFPSIEKAFLSQTKHTSFFSNTGADWHPNLRMEQNLITRGDLPRCVMDSYEECRGPPRLFLLDKFDVAGAGACLKRYTDPSFFKVEAAVEVQREKKIRKVKKKASRWRNGETPEIVPTSHAKLHQLFLEETVEKGHSDPARLVKLKKRQLNASLLDSRPGRSYMEKFLETPESNVVREISVTPLALKLTSDNSSESGFEIHDISTVSPMKKSSQGKEGTYSSPDTEEVVLQPSMDELYGEVIDRQVVKIPERSADGKKDEVPSIPYKEMVEKEIPVDGEGKIDDSVDGDSSDGMISEVDNYMDALTTMESEMETENEYRTKADLGFLNVEKCRMDSDMNEEHRESQAHFSDSQSTGNFSASDDGNGSYKKGRSSFSYSDTPTNLAENTLSDGEGSAKVFPSSEAFVPEIAEMPSNRQLPADVEVLGTNSHDLVLPNDMSIDNDNIHHLGEASSSSCLMDSNPNLLTFDPASSSMQHKLDETPSEYVKLGLESSCIDEIDTNLIDSSVVVSDVPSLTREVSLVTHFTESHSVDNLDGVDPIGSSVAFLPLSNNSEIAYEKKSSNDSADEVLQTDFADKSCAENSVNTRFDSAQSVTSPVEEQVSYSAIPEGEVCSEFTSLPNNCSNVVEPNDLVSEADVIFPENETYPETSTSRSDTMGSFSFKELQVSNVENDMPGVELVSSEKAAVYSEEANLEDISMTAESEEVGVSTCKVVAVEGDYAHRDLPSTCIGCSVLEDRNSLGGVSEIVKEESMVVSTAATDDVLATASTKDDIGNVVCPPQDLIHSSSINLVNLQESPFGTEDLDEEGLEFDEPVSPECLVVSEAEKEINPPEIVPKDFNSDSCRLVSYENSNSKMVHNDSSLADSTQDRKPAGDVIIAPASSALSDQELKSECLHQNCLAKDGEDSTSLPGGQLTKPDICSEQSQKLQADQLDMEVMQTEEASFNSSNHHSQLIQSVNHIDQEILFDGGSESCQDLPSQHSPSDYLAQSTGQEINSVKNIMPPLGSVLPSFGLINEANQVNLEEAPPLPPLPPMQWRIGKIQHAPLISQREFINNSHESFPSILPFRDDEKAQFGFPDQQRGVLQPGNPFSPLTKAEMENLHISQQEVGNIGQPTPHLLQKSNMINDANIQQNSLVLEGTQSQNPVLTLSTLPEEKPDHGFVVSEVEVVQSSTHPFLSVPDGTYSACKQEPVPSQEKIPHPNNLFMLETGLEGKALQPTSQTSDGEHGIPSDISGLSPRKVQEQPQPNLSTSEGESAWSSNPFALFPTSDVGNTNGSSIVKVPRPRNPLIDAVAALDKSKLRKVTERVQPQNGPKLDERDSLLEQIRTKSFNLKRAVLSRPSIQGPKTNLRVAAILEKANAIRQATAGSDEDDDEDSWSDS